MKEGIVMKKILKLIFVVFLLLISLFGCNKEITLEPIAENAIEQYLKGQDFILDNNDYTGTYTIVSRTCDKKTDELVVSYVGSSALYDYEAKYQVKSVATKNGWVIEKFEIIEFNHTLKDLGPSVFKDLLEGVDKNVTSGMGGTYSLISKEVEENTIKFLVKYVSGDGKYIAEYDGEAAVKDGKLELQKVVVNTISSGGSSSGDSGTGSSDTGSSGDSSGDSGATTLSKNYDPNKKAADYGYKAPAKQKWSDSDQEVAYFIEDIKPGMVVTKVEYLGTGGYSRYNYNVTYEDRYKYVKDVYVQYFELYWDGSVYSVYYNEMKESYVNSNFEGVYVNKANGSYIILHENWSFELHEFYMDGSTIKKAILNEYHRISGTSMKWQNRNKAFKAVWTNGAEPDGFAVTIKSINELRLDADILSSKSGDVFIKVAE
jgi:hypothetical protein